MRIDPNFVASLSDDPDQALFKMEEHLSELIKGNMNEQNWLAEQFYLDVLNEFARYIGDDELYSVTSINIERSDAPFEDFNYVRSCVDKRKIKSSFSIAKKKKENSLYIGLTPDARQQIQTYISHIRDALHRLEIPQNKKEAIFGALNRLSQEVDTDRTWSESVADLAIRLADTVDEVDKKLNPIRRLFQNILKRLNEAKQEEETLCKPNETSQIEKRPEDASQDVNDLPF